MNPAVKRRIKKILLWMEILFILVLGAGMGIVLAVAYQVNKLLPPDSVLDHYRAPVPTKIWSSDGILLAKIAAENREPIPLEKIPKNMQDAIVAIEDARFYQHSGLDFRGLGRAVVANLSGHELAQGGSTITQQLARNMFLSPRKTLSRKLKELLLALQIERNWTKKQILEGYLNQVYFGAGAYGVRAAAQAYFGKDPSKLTLAEASTLAGMVQRPSYLSPYASYANEGNYDRTKSRRNMVLDRMADLGFITREEANKTAQLPVKVLKVRPRMVGYFRAKYFVQYVVDQLRDQYHFDEDILNKSGLEIVTTLNWKMQKLAERVAREKVDQMRTSFRVSEASLVTMDPHTGYIRTMVGGVNQSWEKYQFNVATQGRRQPGSSFKAFVYAAAFENGDNPSTGVAAAAKPIQMPDGKWYQPKNHGKNSGGYTNYTSAFAASINGAAVNVFEKTGPRKVVELAKQMGLTGRIYAYPSTALGTTDATPLEMATAYGVFANKGRKAEPIAIIQIRSQDGEVLNANKPKISEPILKPETVEYMDILTRAVVTSGTGTYARIVPDAHGKTGTSEEFTDAWFCGYTPDLVTVVWAGNRDNSDMKHVYGATISVPIWADYMKEAVELNPGKKAKPMLAAVPTTPRERRRRKDETPKPTSIPVTADGSDRNRVRVTVCAESGLIARDDCPSKRTEDFLLGEQPMQVCPIHHASEKKETPPPDPNAPDQPAGTNTGNQ